MSGEDGSGEITRHLIAWRDGSEEAPRHLFGLLYDQLRVMARIQLRRLQPGRTLDTTALLHEAYLRLVDQTRADYRDRGHFFAVAATVMRHILVDEARRQGAVKRQPGEAPSPSVSPGGDARLEDLLDVNDALDKLERLDPRLVRIVEMRFFGGLSVEETAEAMAVSPRTVKREWQKARAFLYVQLGNPEAS